MATEVLAKQSLEDRIHQAADRLAPEIRRTFLDAVETLKRKVNVGELSDLLETGGFAEALESLEGVRLTAEELAPIKDTLAELAQGTAQQVAAEFNLDFALVNQTAVRWAERHAATLVTGVDSETMKAIRRVVVRGQSEGINVRIQAQQIRRIVGLTRRDAEAVSRFTEGLISAGVRDSQIADRAERMARRLLRRRAENIARTETIRAANMGTQLGWEAAQSEGLLPAQSFKVWIATEDARTCPICAVLDGNVIGLGESFSVESQATSFSREGDEFRVADTVPLKRPTTERTPPAHPSCRCTMGLELSGEGVSDTADRDLRRTLSGDTEALPDEALVPQWNRDTGEFEGFVKKPVEVDVSLLPEKIRGRVEKQIRDAVNDFDPEFRPPNIKVISDAQMGRGGGAEYDGFGFRIGGDSVNFSESYFLRGTARIKHTIRHETGHRIENVLRDRLQRRGVSFQDATIQIRQGSESLVRDWLTSLDPDVAEASGLSYPATIARQATTDNWHGISVWGETFAESVGNLMDGGSIPPELASILKLVLGG